MTMKKNYEQIQLEIVFFCSEDIVRTSQNDNVENLPDFPENFEPWYYKRVYGVELKK